MRKTVRGKGRDGNGMGRLGNDFVMYEGVNHGFTQGTMRKKIKGES